MSRLGVVHGWVQRVCTLGKDLCFVAIQVTETTIVQDQSTATGPTARVAVGEVTEVAIDSDSVQGGREVVQRVQKIEVRTKMQYAYTKGITASRPSMAVWK